MKTWRPQLRRVHPIANDLRLSAANAAQSLAAYAPELRARRCAHAVSTCMEATRCQLLTPAEAPPALRKAFERAERTQRSGIFYDAHQAAFIAPAVDVPLARQPSLALFVEVKPLIDDAALHVLQFLALELLPIVVPHGLHYLSHLSTREAELLSLLGAGCDVEQTRLALGVRPQTVRTYIRDLHRRFGVQSWAELFKLRAVRETFGVPTTGAPLDRLKSLDGRMRQVCTLLLEGLNEKEIATTLRVSPHTVRDAVKGIYRRLGVHRRPELLSLAAFVERV